MLSLFSVNTYAQEKKNKRGEKGKGFKMLQELNLSKEQIAKLKEFQQAFREKRKQMKGMSNPKDDRKKMEQLFLDNKSDNELKALHHKIQDENNRQANLRLEKMIFMKNLLNAKQRKLYLQSQGQRKPKRNRDQRSRQ